MRGYGDLADVDPRRKDSCIKGLHRSTSSRGNETRIIRLTSTKQSRISSESRSAYRCQGRGMSDALPAHNANTPIDNGVPTLAKASPRDELGLLRVGPCVLRSLSKSVRVASRVGLAMSRNCLSLEIIRRQNPSDSDARIGLFWVQDRLGFTL